MSMFKILGVIVTIIATSCYFFPFSFPFFQIANTKMILAVFALPIIMVKVAKDRKGSINKDFFVISLFACGVSLASLISMTLNDTPDAVYLTYIISMWVWLGGAYTVVSLMKAVHGKVSVEIVCHYLTAVCVMQCILAILIDNYPLVRILVDSIFSGAQFYFEKERLYGIGCALDVAGGRFAAVLIMIAFLLLNISKQKKDNLKLVLLLVSFVIIAVIGNMIGRTTTVGLILSIFIIVMGLYINQGVQLTKLRNWILGFVLVAIGIFVYLYNTSEYWHDYLEFGFEGFFSLVETGRWEVHSNEMLQEGFIFPDNIRGWLIGDGYFGDTNIVDPYYIGPTWYGFYKGTDAGYSRFLFYFGLLGLIAFSAFFVKVCQVCMRTLPQYKYMFLAILCLNFLIWIKVSTDIFIVFAPFLCLLSENRMDCEQKC